MTENENAGIADGGGVGSGADQGAYETEPATETAKASAAGATAADTAAPGEWPNRDQQWQRVSPKYAWADLTINLVLSLAVAVVIPLVLVFGDRQAPVLVYVMLGVVVAALLVSSALAFRRVRAIGYILRQDDLLFRRGIMFERVVAVPYGRLQLVDVTRGPLLRWLGLATLKFVTASATTGVNLPGLPLEEAEALRDRLVELAEIRRSGL